MKLSVLAGTLCLTLAAAAPVRAQATPYLPTLDPAYGDLDALVAAGWVRGAILGERPYSRLTMARYAVEARRRLAGDSVGAPRARLTEALERLERQLTPELAELCAVGEGPGPAGPGCSEPTRGVAVRALSADGTFADSPSRRIPSSYDFPTSDYIDADLNPLLQRNQGRILANGETMAVEGVFEGTAGRHFAAQAHPRLWTLHDRASGGSADATLVDGYARAVFGDFAIDAGRLHVAMGHGHEAGPVLSHNARGLDQLRFSLDRPVRAGVFGRLTLSTLIADLGSNIDTPHSKLVIGNLLWQPHPMLELTATALNQQGGQGSPSATFKERLLDLFLLSWQGSLFSDKVLAGGIALTVPRARTRFYVDGMTTDVRTEFYEVLSTEAAWIWGARTTGLGSAGRLDLWAELRRAGVRPHTHHQFTSGETQDRRVIGDALGPLGRSLAGGAEWRGAAHSVSAELDFESYNNADLYQILPSDERFVWTKTRDLPDESRARFIGAWSVDPRSARVGGSVRLGVESVDAFDFNSDRGRVNAFLQAQLEYRPR